MHVLHYKLKTLKPKLKIWNRAVVGDLHQQVHRAHQHLSDAQLAIDHLGFSVERSNEELSCITNYNQALQRLNNFWQDKHKQARFLEGDRNSAFFHRSCKIRDAHNYIGLL